MKRKGKTKTGFSKHDKRTKNKQEEPTYFEERAVWEQKRKKIQNCRKMVWGVEVLVDCWCMMVVDALEKCSRKPYKNRVF